MSSNANFFERYRGVFVRVGALIAIVVAIVLVVRYMGESGPEERFRVVHPSGYSVIHPRDWEAGIVRTPDANGFIDAISLSPKNWKGLQPSMWVRRYGHPPDLKKLESMGFRPVDFQGQSAWGQQSQPRTHLLRTAIFQRGDSWYNLSVSLPGLEGARIEDYWKYIESFRGTGAGAGAGAGASGSTVTTNTATAPATDKSP